MEDKRNAARFFVAGERSGKLEVGSAELNLLEFPFALLSDAHDGRKTLESNDSILDAESGTRIYRKWIVAGAEKWGLPTAFDLDLSLALMKLTKEQHGWSDNFLRFSIYEVCKQLRVGRNFYTKRIQEGILRIKGTTIVCHNSWRRKSKWVSLEAFSLLDNVRLSNTKQFYDADEEQCVKWNDVVVESMQADHSKGLDWDFYLSLKLATTKRLGLFLDKRWDHMAGLTYGLEDFCANKLGMKGGQEAFKYRQNIKRPVDELAARGFPVVVNFDGRGQNSRVIFEKKAKRKSRALESKQPAVASEPNGVVAALIERGVTNGAELVAKNGADHCRKQLENFDHRRAMGEEKGAGWLGKACALESGFGTRKDFESKAEREEKAKALAEKRRLLDEKSQEADEVRRQAEIKEEARVREHLNKLPNDEAREALKQAALQRSPIMMAGYRRALDKGDSEGAAVYLEAALKAHLKPGLEAASA